MRIWVVIEWNQASGMPSVAYNGEPFWNAADAEDCAEQLREETRKTGRRERYTVNEVDLGEDW